MLLFTPWANRAPAIENAVANRTTDLCFTRMRESSFMRLLIYHAMFYLPDIRTPMIGRRMEASRYSTETPPHLLQSPHP
jgi:hypothetical protein